MVKNREGTVYTPVAQKLNQRLTKHRSSINPDWIDIIRNYAICCAIDFKIKSTTEI